MIEKLAKFKNSLLNKYFILFLLIIVLISYGQILSMYVWQDDNGLFFKLAHIQEKAGYLGPGPFGNGAYKYIQTPYIPIYHLFKFNTVAYFSFTLLIYFLATICVYKVFSIIFGKEAGRLAGFLYAAGYIASDGFIRLFNSVITSVSIILISLLFLSYYKYYKDRNIKWYFLALALFFLATELIVGRTHYLIGTVLVFELLFLSFEKPLKSLFYSFLRLVPYIYIFYYYYVLNGDHRSGNVKSLLVGLSKGEFYQLYSFITSYLNIVIPDWITQAVIKLSIGLNITTWIVTLISLVLTYILLKDHAKRRILLPLFVFTIVIWKLLVNDFFSTQILNLQQQQFFLIYLGGLAFIFTFIIFLIIEKYKKLYLFFISWVLLNLAAYSAYNPTITYESVNRYLAHSFFAWIGVLGVVYLSSKKNSFSRKLVLTLIIFWGVGNLITSTIYQNNILKNRSNPPKAFYNQLKEYVPTLSKGDILYFDVADTDQRFFEEAFSVASMPETTAIAWRYGLDRYDIQRFTNFKEFADDIKSQNVPQGKIYTFFYKDQKLIDTTKETREALFNKTEPKELSFETNTDKEISFKESINSTAPIELFLDIEATPISSQEITFPYQSKNYLVNAIYDNPKLQNIAINYAKFKSSFFKSAKFSSSTEWRERKLEYLFDQNPDTIWQADRVVWQKRNEHFIIDVGSPVKINKLVWINGFGNNTPTNFKVEASLDNKNWKIVKEFNEIKRVDTKDPQVVEFEPEIARFIRMVITQTIGGDSPAIAEAWVIPFEFNNLNIREAEKFIKQPFDFIGSESDYNRLLSLLGYKGKVQIYWMSNKDIDFQTEFDREVDIIFDGVEREIKVIIPAGGTHLSKIKLMNATIPIKINVRDIKVRYLNIDEYSIN